MSDTDPHAHNNSVERIFPRLGKTARTVEILDTLNLPTVRGSGSVRLH
jgi:hypothetical protein